MDRWNSTRLNLKKNFPKNSGFFSLADNRTYLRKNGLETIPEHLWCPQNECNSIGRPRVMLNLLCIKNNSLICLGTRCEWKPAPYVCKRIRPKDRKYSFF